VRDVAAQDVLEMAPAQDQNPVEALGPHSPYEPFRDRVRPWRPHRRLHDLHALRAENLVERAGELRVPVADQVTNFPELLLDRQVARLLSDPGAEIGALLRREGLYSSLLTEWRRAREAGALSALERPRGRRAAQPLEVENAELRRRAERAEAELERARRVIEVQGNVSALLGQLLEPRGATPDASTER
jgi:hypothetical protein